MIDFLKKYTFPIGLKKSLKSGVKRYSTGYAEAEKILIFFTSEGNQKIVLVRSLINKLEKEGKKVRCFYLLLHDEDKPDVHLDEGMSKLTKEDFSMFGEVQEPGIRELLQEEFDYFIHADTECSIYSDLILAQSKARCRIGKYFEGHEDQYDLMIKIGEDRKVNYLLQQIYHYAKAL